MTETYNNNYLKDIFKNDNKSVLIVKDRDTTNKFIDTCRNIYKLSLLENNSVFCGIDFEFNMNWKKKDRYIGLMQIILIDNFKNYFDNHYEKKIFLLSPHHLDTHNKKKLIKYIFCSKVIKIFHGSDSLDYPHVYNELLGMNKKKFLKFINNSIDTRFLCEISKRIMVRAGILDISNKKCSLYIALYDHNVIDKNLLDHLECNASKINYNKKWIIENMSSNQTIYSAYDVAYLYDLSEKITKSIEYETPSDRNDIDVISLVNRLYRFHMINKLELSSISSKCKFIVDNHHIKKDDMMVIDQKIMEIVLTNIIYVDNNGVKHKIKIVLEDILGLDTIRKTILNCLRVYQENISSSDQEYIYRRFEMSRIFNNMKGHETIKHIIQILKNKQDLHSIQ